MQSPSPPCIIGTEMRDGRFASVVAALVLAWSPWAEAGELGEPSEAAAKIARLVKDLGAESFDVREKATAELSVIGDAALPALEEAVRSPDAEVRSRAELLLKDIRWRLPKALAERLGVFAREFAGYRDADPDRQMGLLAEFQSLAPSEAERYILMAFKEDRSSEGRTRLASLLGGCRSAEAEALMLELSGAEDATCRQFSAIALGRFPGDKPLSRLCLLVADPDPDVRRAALDAIANRGLEGRGGAKAVEASLEDQDLSVRSAAVRAAGRVGLAGAQEKLWKLAGSGDVSVRTAAIWAMAELAAPGDEAATARLASLLEDTLPAVRAQTVRALVAMRATGVRVKLGELLSNPDPSLAADAAWALGELGPGDRSAELCRASRSSGDRSLAIASVLALLRAGDEEAARLAADMLGKASATEASLLAKTLVEDGDPKWIPVLCAAEKRRQEDEFTGLSLSLRDGVLRDPDAFAPHVARLAKPNSGLGYAVRAEFLADHALFAEAAAIQPAAEQSRASRGVLLLEAGRGSEGMQLLRDAASVDPMDAVAQNNLAWFLLTASRAELRDKAGGLRLAGRAAALEPRAAFILDTHAWALHLNGNSREALARIEEAIFWTSPGIHSERSILDAHRARILIALGRRQEGAAALSAVLKARPRDVRLRAEAARAYCDLGDAAEARLQLEQMLALDFPDVEVIANDPDLAPMRRGPEFDALLKRANEARDRLKQSLSGILDAHPEQGPDEDQKAPAMIRGGAGEGG